MSIGYFIRVLNGFYNGEPSGGFTNGYGSPHKGLGDLLTTLRFTNTGVPTRSITIAFKASYRDPFSPGPRNPDPRRSWSFEEGRSLNHQQEPDVRGTSNHKSCVPKPRLRVQQERMSLEG